MAKGIIAIAAEMFAIYHYSNCNKIVIVIIVNIVIIVIVADMFAETGI